MRLIAIEDFLVNLLQDVATFHFNFSATSLGISKNAPNAPNLNELPADNE